MTPFLRLLPRGGRKKKSGTMAGDPQTSEEQDCSFVWDEASQLYYHAGTGFYHDPNGGWYYSSRDGVYYKFEDGNYVPLDTDTVDKSNTQHCEGSSSEFPAEDGSFSHECAGRNENLLIKEDSSGSYAQDGIAPENSVSDSKCAESPEPEHPPPPSEWLEDTLIELYLSNYTNPGVDDSGDVRNSADACDGTDIDMLPNEESEEYELEEGEWIPEEDFAPSESVEAISEDEESWRAQYGQVPQSREEPLLDIPAVDLWDWSMVTEAGKDGKVQLARIVGRPVKQTVKLHPSVPSGGGKLKTAPICQASFDLVRVRTGQVYKLRTPSAKYLASVSLYDSSNPTKDWGFPELSMNQHSLLKSSKNRKHKGADGARSSKKLLVEPDRHLVSAEMIQKYRDRAAERRILHGGFGFGPGQKNSLSQTDDGQSSPPSASTEEAAAEAMDMAFGAGSYARKVLESMGWKKGEALGSTNKGLLEPIQAVGNVGSAGLGWPQGTKRK